MGTEKKNIFSSSQTLRPTSACFALASLAFSFMSVNREAVNSLDLTSQNGVIVEKLCKILTKERKWITGGVIIAHYFAYLSWWLHPRLSINLHWKQLLGSNERKSLSLGDLTRNEKNYSLVPCLVPCRQQRNKVGRFSAKHRKREVCVP